MCAYREKKTPKLDNEESKIKAANDGVRKEDNTCSLVDDFGSFSQNLTEEELTEQQKNHENSKGMKTT